MFLDSQENGTVLVKPGRMVSLLTMLYSIFVTFSQLQV